MLLRHSLGLDAEAKAVERAVSDAVASGASARTKDLGGTATTVSAADEILARLASETTAAASR
jgi:3-isopropylmalate dehydrogenase